MKAAAAAAAKAADASGHRAADDADVYIHANSNLSDVNNSYLIKNNYLTHMHSPTEPTVRLSFN